MHVPSITLLFILLSFSFGPALSIPQMTTFNLLPLPKCALQCFTSALASDGCASETDFRCHCTSSKVLIAATPCIKKYCNASDEAKALGAVRSACMAAGVDLGNNGNGNGGSSSKGPESSTHETSSGGRTITPAESARPSSPTSSTRSLPPPQITNPSSIPAATSSNPASLPPAPTPTPSSTTLVPTPPPLGPPPTPRTLSSTAKAGIAVSVTAISSLILTSILLYIRRLKRDLRAARAAAAGAAGVPESVWREHIETVIAAGGSTRSTRQNSIRRGGRVILQGLGIRRGMSLRDGDRDADWRDEDNDFVGYEGEYSGGEYPSSFPYLAPTTTPRNLLNRESRHAKKKRVLSVVVERADEETEIRGERFVREPVAGQREGLVGALEIDGYERVLVEAPVSITPKSRRSREGSRDRERGDGGF